MRVLFVEDEPRSLEGLRKALDGLVPWEMDFAGSSAHALTLLGQREYAVMVTGASDSVSLVRRAKLSHPGVARLVRSDDSDVAGMLRTLFASHQLVDPQIDLGRLVAQISEAADLQMMLADEELRALVDKVDRLPARPRVYAELVNLLARPDADFRAVGKLVQSDVAIAAEIVRVVNTPFFSRGRSVTNVIDAVGRLGTRVVRDLVLAVEVFQSFSVGKLATVVESIHRHSVDVAVAARSLVTRREDQDNAFLAGLLHDVGRLVIVASVPESIDILGGEENLAAERDLLGVTHCEIGAYVIGMWGLPYDIMWAAASHHEPAVLGEGRLDVAAAVYVAQQIAEGAAGELDESFRVTVQSALGTKSAN